MRAVNPIVPEVFSSPFCVVVWLLWSRADSIIKCVKEQRDCERRVSGQFSKELASVIKLNLLGKKITIKLYINYENLDFHSGDYI